VGGGLGVGAAAPALRPGPATALICSSVSLRLNDGISSGIPLRTRRVTSFALGRTLLRSVPGYGGLPVLGRPAIVWHAWQLARKTCSPELRLALGSLPASMSRPEAV
jgi:hypothetical protein